jgi:metal-responsive CopG/Arc/MetJ family transcriptional regulator
MRIPVDLSASQIQALDALSNRNKRSRNALIRQAIDAYLEKSSPDRATDAFGLSGKRKVDGLVYQEKLRGKW